MTTTKPLRPRAGAFRRHFSGRVDPLTSAILVFPLFLTYQLGILGGHGQNGVDLVTRALIELCKHDLANYLLALAAMLVGYAAILVILRHHGSFHPNRFLPVLLESGFYALSMGSLILFAMSKVTSFFPGLSVPVLPELATGNASPLDILVISAGAGLHEELVFRVVVMGGLAWLLSGIGARSAWLVALVVSSLVFSLAHHLGPMGEPFAFAAFIYRTLAGVFFAIVYQVRGFAVAAWTHALYDLYVLGILA